MTKEIVKYPKMDKKIKAKWLEALFSGEFKQTRGRLKNERSGGMCCLGVLCNVVNPEGWDGTTFRYKNVVESFLLPEGIQHEARIYEDVPYFLSNKNDVTHWNFLQIGNWIKENL